MLLSPKSTSIVVTPTPDYKVTPHALFCTLTLADGSHVQPEIYPRPDNTLYVCGAGMSDRTPLPAKAQDVEFSEEGVQRLKTRLLAVVENEWVQKRFEENDFVKQACYRPDSSKTGLPLIGSIGKGCVYKLRNASLDCTKALMLQGFGWPVGIRFGGSRWVYMLAH